MFKNILTTLPLLHLALAAPTSNILPRDGTGSVVTAPNALAWYSTTLTAGTSGLTDPSSYTCYTGSASNFPAMSTWVSFGTMWNQSLQYTFAYEPNTKAQTQDIYNSIVSVSKLAKVDARVILATILLESSGNLSVACSLSPAGQIPNCGLMQSYNGTSFNSAAPVKSITQMVVDGTQGTNYGPGLVQLFNDAANTPKQSNGNPYIVFREYNSGSVDLTDLGNANGANPAYVSHMANYLQGWNGYGNSTLINQKCGFKASAPATPTPTPGPTCAAKNYVAPPTATVAGTTPDCCKWVVPVAGDSCYSIDQANGITLDQFQSWNTYIDAACDNLWAGTAYCVNGNVAAAGGSSTSSSSVATSTSTKTTSTKATSTKPTTTKSTITRTKTTTSKPATTTKSSTTKVVKKTKTPATISSSKKIKTKSTATAALTARDVNAQATVSSTTTTQAWLPPSRTATIAS